MTQEDKVREPETDGGGDRQREGGGSGPSIAGSVGSPASTWHVVAAAPQTIAKRTEARPCKEDDADATNLKLF